MDLLKNKQLLDSLYNRIADLEAKFSVAADDRDYYLSLLLDTRSNLIEIHNLSGAVPKVPDCETADDAWERCINEIKETFDA